MSFWKSLAKVAGTIVLAPITVTNTVAKGVGSVVKEIPVIGSPLASVINLGNAPIDLIEHIAEGDRIDQAVLNNIKSQVKDVKEIAPYAKMVVSLVPGVGTAVSAALAAGSALCTGQSITSALVEGIKGAIPGGALAQTAFNISNDVISGKSLDDTVVNALPLSSSQKDALKTTVSMAKQLASGKNVVKTVLTTAQAQLPQDVRDAINIGLAIGFAQTQQPGSGAVPIVYEGIHGPLDPSAFNVPEWTTHINPNQGPQDPSAFNPPEYTKTMVNQEAVCIDIGKTIVPYNLVLKAGLYTLTNQNDVNGYYAGIGLMYHTATPAEIEKFYNILNPADLNGFNIGAAAVVGIKHLKPTGNYLLDFGCAVAYGLNGAPEDTKLAVVSQIGQNPTVKAGILEVAKARSAGIIHKLLVALHIIKESQYAT